MRGRVSGHEDEGQGARVLEQGVEELTARFAGHLNVAEHEIKMLVLQMFPGALTVGDAGDRVPF